MLSRSFRPSEFKHVVLDEAGRALINGTRYQVRMLGVERFLHGWSPEEMKWQHPDLSMGQICAALAYYYDHIDEMEAETEAEQQEVERLRAGHHQITRAELERRRAQR